MSSRVVVGEDDEEEVESIPAPAEQSAESKVKSTQPQHQPPKRIVYRESPLARDLRAKNGAFQRLLRQKMSERMSKLDYTLGETSALFDKTLNSLLAASYEIRLGNVDLEELGTVINESLLPLDSFHGSSGAVDDSAELP